MAIDSAISNLHKSHQAGQEKYTYFLLAASGTAIGFAVQKTEGLTLSWWLLPVAASTLFWAASFYCGCKNIDWVHCSIGANYNLLQLKQGIHPSQPQHSYHLEVAVNGVRAALESNVSKSGFYGRWQFRFLISGAVFFIGWRIAEMARASY